MLIYGRVYGLFKPCSIIGTNRIFIFCIGIYGRDPVSFNFFLRNYFAISFRNIYRPYHNFLVWFPVCTYSIFRCVGHASCRMHHSIPVAIRDMIEACSRRQRKALIYGRILYLLQIPSRKFENRPAIFQYINRFLILYLYTVSISVESQNTAICSRLCYRQASQRIIQNIRILPVNRLVRPGSRPR